jgi:predicted acyltransferase (DUF342 family)
MKKDKCSSTGKVIFVDKQNADNAIEVLKSIKSQNNKIFRNNKKTKDKISQSRSYFCIHCKGYHLTSMASENNYKQKQETQKDIDRKNFLKNFDIKKWKSDSLSFESGHIPPPKNKK